MTSARGRCADVAVGLALDERAAGLYSGPGLAARVLATLDRRGEQSLRKEFDAVKIKVGSAMIALLVAVMLWLLGSHTVDWLLSTLPH